MEKGREEAYMTVRSSSLSLKHEVRSICNVHQTSGRRRETTRLEVSNDSFTYMVKGKGMSYNVIRYVDKVVQCISMLIQ